MAAAIARFGGRRNEPAPADIGKPSAPARRCFSSRCRRAAFDWSGGGPEVGSLALSCDARLGSVPAESISGDRAEPPRAARSAPPPEVSGRRRPGLPHDCGARVRRSRRHGSVRGSSPVGAVFQGRPRSERCCSPGWPLQSSGRAGRSAAGRRSLFGARRPAERTGWPAPLARLLLPARTARYRTPPAHRCHQMCVYVCLRARPHHPARRSSRTPPESSCFYALGALRRPRHPFARLLHAPSRRRNCRGIGVGFAEHVLSGRGSARGGWRVTDGGWGPRHVSLSGDGRACRLRPGPTELWAR